MTLGEIIYMENEASERDQINWACSAQNSKLLPKKKVSPQKSKERAAQAIKAKVSPIFENYYAKHGRGRKVKKEGNHGS